MKLKLSEYKIEKGAFAEVFINEKSNTALKLFKSYNHPDLDGTSKVEIGEFEINSYRENVFNSEIEAYKLIQESDLLKQFTPTYYGIIDVFSVIYKNGEDITSRYLTKCCYKMDFIEGENCKLNILISNLKLLESLQNKIRVSLAEIVDEFRRMKVDL